MRIFVDMDGTLAKWKNVEFNKLYEEGYYRNLEPNQELLNEVNKLIEQKEDIYILSAYLTESKYAKKEKEEWIKQYLPNLEKEKQIFVPYGTNKAKYLKENYSPITKEDYLVDDYTKNLNEWESYGGVGVKYLNGINHTKGTWKGILIGNNQFNNNNVISLSNIIDTEKLKDNYIKGDNGSLKIYGNIIKVNQEFDSQGSYYKNSENYKLQKNITIEQFNKLPLDKKIVYVPECGEDIISNDNFEKLLNDGGISSYFSIKEEIEQCIGEDYLDRFTEDEIKEMCDDIFETVDWQTTNALIYEGYLDGYIDEILEEDEEEPEM